MQTPWDDVPKLPVLLGKLVNKLHICSTSKIPAVQHKVSLLSYNQQSTYLSFALRVKLSYTRL